MHTTGAGSACEGDFAKILGEVIRGQCRGLTAVPFFKFCLLCRPVYTPATKTVAASYVVFNGTDASLPTSGGVANSVLSSVSSSSTGKPPLKNACLDW